MPIYQAPGAITGVGDCTQPTGLQDQLVSETTRGGPLSAEDVRMVFDRKDLEHLISVASSSLSGRVILHGVGIKQKTWRGGDGKVYQTLSIVCRAPQPEPTPYDSLKR